VLLGALAVCAQIGNSAAASSSSAADRLDLRAARADARKAIRWQPWSAEPWRLLAEAQLTAGNVEAARVSLRRALRRDPTNWELWYVLAAASEGPAQRAALERAARLNPFSPEIAALREAERKV
jgi:Tfp pilus assembly protein PilF